MLIKAVNELRKDIEMRNDKVQAQLNQIEDQDLLVHCSRFVTVDDVHQVFEERTSYQEAWTIDHDQAESLLKAVAGDINQAIETAIAQVLEDACEEKIDEMVVDNFEEQEEQDRRKEWDERKG